MKALSVRQPWASMIARGEKTIECRSWPTKYRGPLLICAAKKPYGSEPVGVAVAVVRLVDCRRFRVGVDEAAAGCPGELGSAEDWAWVLAEVEPVEPIPVSGKLGLFEVATLIRRKSLRASVASQNG
jgi:hypothetical protein